jgi:hypothetical protein
VQLAQTLEVFGGGLSGDGLALERTGVRRIDLVEPEALAGWTGEL